MITRCYLEITNSCNLDCVFCPKTERAKHRLSLDEFELLTDRLMGKVEFLYFHLMGEPFLHPLLPQFIQIARKKNFVPVLTTNGTLLSKAQGVIEARPHKIQISLHSHEGNAKEHPEEYIRQVMTFVQEAASQGILIVLRLWNEGGYDTTNDYIQDLISQYQPRPWTQRHDGWKLGKNLYIEYDRMFEWPDAKRNEFDATDVFCYALRNQIGVLVDGSVVPCCLDHAGDIVLGNLFNQSLEEILQSPRAQALYNGFTNHRAVEPLCQRCGYAIITKQYRKNLEM
ncbi:MAG: SPASM domain-containing protein [Bacteroides sp.]|nr:SPASM domain-containing protein [Bacteroides sp.]